MRDAVPLKKQLPSRTATVGGGISNRKELVLQGKGRCFELQTARLVSPGNVAGTGRE